MDREASALLERILLDESEEPTSFPIGLLKSITNNFSNDQKIGSGGFADVYKGQLQNCIVAVKKLKQQSEMVETKFIEEVQSMMKVKHKNVVRFLGYCSDTQGKMWKHGGKNIMAEERERFLCFEFLPQGSLDKHISDASSGLEWRMRYHIIKGICEGLHYLHGEKIVHSDLKPENILLDHIMVPKIGDFGLARSFHEEQTRAITQNVVGTLYYMAPECFRGVISFESDIYSLGMIITEMLTGQKKDDLSIENVNENWTTRFKTSHGGTWLEHVRVCAEIGLECMDFDPKKRPTIGHIIDRLAELERTYGFFETDLPATHVLEVYPLDIWFPKSDKVIKCPVTLTNRTDDLIGVWMAPTTLTACFNPDYPYVWEQPEYIKDDCKSSIFTRLGPHSSETIYMTIRKKEQQPPLEAADKGMFDVVMIATKSEEELKRLDGHWNYGMWRQNKSEDPLRRAKELGTLVHLATLTATITSDPARCHEVVAHQFIGATTPDGEHAYINCMDVHPTETWLLMGISDKNPHVSIWNYERQKSVTKFEVTYLEKGKYFYHISSIKSIAGEQWFAAGDDRGGVHVYPYNTNRCRAEDDKVKEFEAHVGERSAVTQMAVHPEHTLLLTASCNDKSIKLWDWSQGWTCTRVIDEHDSVYALTAGPRDSSTFASSASHDRIVKVWDIHSLDATSAVEGWRVTFYTANHCHFLATLCRERSSENVKIWDLQTKKHVHTLCRGMIPREHGQLENLACHPTLPILAGIMEAAGSKVHEVVMWDVRTYRVMKRVELLVEGDWPKMVFDGSEDIISLVVVTTNKEIISIIKINVTTLLTGC